MENRQKRQAMEELDEKELGKVNGGIYVPARPDDDDDENSGGSGGGATGGW